MNYKSSLFKLPVSLFLLFFCSACGTTDPGDPDISGRWIGVSTVNSATIEIDLLINQNESSMTGSGVMQFLAQGESLLNGPIDVTGTYRFPNTALIIDLDSFTFAFSGEISADENSISGVIDGAGIDSFPVTIVRQR